MDRLTRKDLYSLEDYASRRSQFRGRVMEHKKNRIVAIGPNATLHFEDRLTIQYQIQEMLRAERIFESEGIDEELNVYNSLIPDGRNFKATFMIEYEDVEERQRALARLRGIEDRVWVRVGTHERVWAIADEDLDRQTEEKTSAVHFLRFELDAESAARAKAGEPIAVGIDHENYSHHIDPLPVTVRDSLAADLDD